MGRKKRKIDSSTEPGDELGVGESNDQPGDIEAFSNNVDAESVAPTGVMAMLEDVKIVDEEATPNDSSKKVISSSYAMASHSGELIQEDVYVSDGSLDSDDEYELEIVLTSSRMGIMRRGLHHQMLALQQPNRQWKRQELAATTGTTEVPLDVSSASTAASFSASTSSLSTA